MGYGLKDTKAGDKVEQDYQSGFARRTRIVTVTRTTPTLIYVGDIAYLRSNGHERGVTGYNPPGIMAITPENEKQVAQRALDSEVAEARDLISRAAFRLNGSAALNVAGYIQTILGDKA